MRRRVPLRSIPAAASAVRSTSSMASTRYMFIVSRTFFGMSARSFSFSRGNHSVKMRGGSLGHHQAIEKEERFSRFRSEEIAQPVAPFGDFGGHSYVANHQGELANHVLAGESDFGADRIYELALPASVAHSEFAQAVMRVLTPIGVLAAARPPEDAGADIAPSVQAGVPPFALAQDGTRYFDIHHTPDDTLDKVDRAQLDQNVAAWAAFAWLAADSNVDFRLHAAPAPPPPG